MKTNGLVWIAVALIAVWVLASVTKFVVGAVLHLFWVIALVLLALWAFRRLR